jgi:deazaflavin-dependent oxidoreductase (nitroreductase family)
MAENADPARPARPSEAPKVPPRWFVGFAWAVHRAFYRVTGGRKGLWPPTPTMWGALRIRTTGRRTGRERIAILGYKLDGANMVTLAMNGWFEGEPAWWLNLQARPEATVETASGPMRVRGRAAVGPERERLWALFPGADRYAVRRSGETAVVVLEPEVRPG